MLLSDESKTEKKNPILPQKNFTNLVYFPLYTATGACVVEAGTG